MRSRINRFIEARVEGDRSIHGLAVPYGQLSGDLGGFRERFTRGSLTRTLAENGWKSRGILLLHSHDSSRPLARTIGGTLTLTDTAEGLAFEARDLVTNEAFDAMRNVRRQIIAHMSFAFYTNRDTFDEERGEIIRTVQEAELTEVSILVNPAYPQTWVRAGKQ